MNDTLTDAITIILKNIACHEAATELASKEASMSGIVRLMQAQYSEESRAMLAAYDAWKRAARQELQRILERSRQLTEGA